MQHIAQEASVFIKLLLVVCLLCGALSLPMCKLMGSQSPYLISAWRCATCALLFLPLAFYEVKHYGDGVSKLFTTKNILLVVLCQVYNTLFVLCQLVAMQYTFTSHVLLFSGMISIVLLFWKIVKRLPITAMEIGGILVAILGSVLITQTSGSESNYTQQSIIVGDLIAFLGSVFGAFNIQLMAPLMQFYRDGIYLVQSNMASCLLSIGALCLSGDRFSISFDPNYGLLGFLHPRYGRDCNMNIVKFG
eukprot:TRINITY_DN1422_c0_g1_i2.p2 TRINITY_DN1422_c0_g1~~TRINITY_DN1422_c0_g1_i2.p2  ORF type:complete len:248 (+),score=18.24 TRINITY_DN1422_c0_g1_i2:463-1206(+)